jgi:hypothetical protein
VRFELLQHIDGEIVFESTRLPLLPLDKRPSGCISQDTSLEPNQHSFCLLARGRGPLGYSDSLILVLAGTVLVLLVVVQELYCCTASTGSGGWYYYY